MDSFTYRTQSLPTSGKTKAASALTFITAREVYKKVTKLQNMIKFFDLVPDSCH